MNPAETADKSPSAASSSESSLSAGAGAETCAGGRATGLKSESFVEVSEGSGRRSVVALEPKKYPALADTRPTVAASVRELRAEIICETALAIQQAQRHTQ